MLYSLGTHRLIQVQIQESLVQAAALKHFKTTHVQRVERLHADLQHVEECLTSTLLISPLGFSLAVMVPIESGDSAGD